eukprot:scaffold246_cov414-Prasinococcus_capsulatus_cf.AAC.2
MADNRPPPQDGEEGDSPDARDEDVDEGQGGNVREQDRFLPIANISRIMKKALPNNAKIAKDAKETVQECVSEFISFITSEYVSSMAQNSWRLALVAGHGRRAQAAVLRRASDKCQREKRKTINGDDLLWAMGTLGFEEYCEPLKVYLHKYREVRRPVDSGPVWTPPRPNLRCA